MIDLKKICYEIGDRVLYDELDFSVKKDEKILISGVSGCGKSTLLQIIVGLVENIYGDIFIDNQKLIYKNVNRLRRNIAYVTQNPIMGAINVKDALLLPYSFSANIDKKPSKEKILEMLDKLKLPESILEQKSTEISGGECQRICLGRALLMERPIILADEMTSALDQESRDLIVDVLLNANSTIVAVSHDVAVIDAFPQKYELSNGKAKKI